MKTRISSLLMIGLFGGIGGLVNASLCYWNITPSEYGGFDLGIFPCGFIHGFLLALIPVGAAQGLMKSNFWFRLAVAPGIGWIAGWLSCGAILGDVESYPTIFSKNQNPTFFERLTDGLGIWVFWPFDDSQGVLDAFLAPLAYFGFVSLLLFGALAFSPLMRKNQLGAIMTTTVLTAVLGSLFWWIVFKNWVNSPIHGAIWGALVGFGIWKFNPLQLGGSSMKGAKTS